MNKAVILFSGGLDSTTTLAIANQQGFQCYAISYDYGQRNIAELQAAKLLAQQYNVIEHKFVDLRLLGELRGSALTDTDIDVPLAVDSANGIPATYVPARNSVFLAIALGWAEVLQARDIFFGGSQTDFSGYPDCRPAYIEAFQHLANISTKAGVEGDSFRIHAPIMHLSKADTIRTGLALGVDFSLTVSCYQADNSGHACGICEACEFRQQGFQAAGIIDPTRYLTTKA